MTYIIHLNDTDNIESFNKKEEAEAIVARYISENGYGVSRTCFNGATHTLIIDLEKDGANR